MFRDTMDAVIEARGGLSPFGFQAGDENLYRFVGNDPIDWTDPSGLQRRRLPTIGGIEAKLNAHPDTKALLDAALKDGVKIEAAPTRPLLPFPGYYDNATKKLWLNLPRIRDDDHGAGVLVFELTRYKNDYKQKELDALAGLGLLSRENYARESERLSYQYLFDARDLVRKAIDAGKLNEGSDNFSAILRELDTFDKYLSYAKDPTRNHYKTNLTNYDILRDYYKKIVPPMLYPPPLPGMEPQAPPPRPVVPPMPPPQPLPGMEPAGCTATQG